MGFYSNLRAWAACSAGILLAIGSGCSMGRPAAPGLGWLSWGRGSQAAADPGLTPPSVTQSPDYPKTGSPGAPANPGYGTGNYSMTADANGPNSANKPQDPAATPSAPGANPAAPGGVAAGPGAWGGANPSGVNQGFYSPEYPDGAPSQPAPSGPAAPAYTADRGAAPQYDASPASAPGYDAAPGYGAQPEGYAPQPGGAAPGYAAAPNYAPAATDPNAAPGYDPNTYAGQGPPAYNAAPSAPGYEAAPAAPAAPGYEAVPGYAGAPPAQPAPGYDPNAPYGGAPQPGAYGDPNYNPNAAPGAGVAAAPTAPMPPAPEAAPYTVPNPYGQPAAPRGRVDVAGGGPRYDAAPSYQPSTSTYGVSPSTNASSTPHRTDPGYRPGGVRDFFPGAGTGADATRSAVQPATYERTQYQ